MSSICRVISAEEVTAVCFSLEEGMETESEESRDEAFSEVKNTTQVRTAKLKE